MVNGLAQNDPIHILARHLLDVNAEDLPAREKRVIEKVAKRLAVSRNVSTEFEEARTYGERLADRVAEIGGSWGFLIGFGIFIVVWTVGNGLLLATVAPDPYPFIFLNLMLSLLAAVQAPIIMMSQNRQSAKDRVAAAHDYEVNLKAEIEIAALHEKLDSLRANELARLIERVEKAVGSK